MDTTKVTTYNEIGLSGYRRYSGIVQEEFLPQLSGSNGIKTYREMSDNDAILGACLFAINQILEEARWSTQPWNASESAKADAAFLNDAMLGMEHSWGDFISEVLSFLIYGWSWFEIVYQRNEDGSVGWKKFAPRLQSSLDSWDIDKNGNVLGLFQRPYPDFVLRRIPIEKSLHFKTKYAGGNPEGRSALRSAYRAWYFKKNLEELEGIGIERDLAGIPLLTPPEQFDANSDDDKVKLALAWAKKLITNLRRDEQEGILIPPGWKIELLASPGKRQFDTTEVINRYNKEMAVTMLAQFILLGMERTGSYALASEQIDMFHLCLTSWLNKIQTVINRNAIPKLFILNGKKTKELPYVVHSDVRKVSLKDLATFINQLSGAQVQIVDDDVKNYLKDLARLKPFNEVNR